MKRILTVILFFISCILSSNIMAQFAEPSEFNSSKKNSKITLDSHKYLDAGLSNVLIQRWKDNQWNDVRRMVYNVNESGFHTTIKYDSNDAGVWKTIMEMTFEYNSNNEILKEFMYMKELDGTVSHATMNECNYADGKLNEIVSSIWNSGSDSWDVSRKDIYEYSQDKLIKTISLSWNESNSNWENSSEDHFTYDSQGREIEIFNKIWDNNNNQFINSNKSTTEYYKELKVSRMESKSWDSILEQWSGDNYSLHEYQYDNNDNCVEYISTDAFGFGGFSILMKFKITYLYDSNNLVVQQYEYTWDEVTSGWTESERIDITNDSNGNPLEEIHYFYLAGNWEKYLKQIYSYDPAVGINLQDEIPTKFALHQNYPNPFNPTTQIEYSVSLVTNIKLIIHNILGQEIKTLLNEVHSPGIYTLLFDASDLPSGTYIITLENETTQISKKCLLLK